MRRLHFGRLALGGNARAFPFPAERRLRGAPPCLELRERELGGLAAPSQLVERGLRLGHFGVVRLVRGFTRGGALALEPFHPGAEAFDLCVELRLLGTMALLGCLALPGEACELALRLDRCCGLQIGKFGARLR